MTAKLQVGLLLCDDVDAADRARHGTYAKMFVGVTAADAGVVLQPVRCDRGELPASPDAFDAYLISGSRAGVYDPLPWIAHLADFVRRCRDARKRTVGVCFGHQLIAHALGGEARKSDAGWGIGIHRARIVSPQGWMDGDGDDAYNLVVMHQDQVAVLPPRASVIAQNDFCPVSMFTADGVMLGIQGHPEFTKAFCEFRINARREIFGDKLYRESLASLKKMQPDSARVLGWIAKFLHGDIS